jgi:hypothetical protein
LTRFIPSENQQCQIATIRAAFKKYGLPAVESDAASSMTA